MKQVVGMGTCLPVSGNKPLGFPKRFLSLLIILELNFRSDVWSGIRLAEPVLRFSNCSLHGDESKVCRVCES